MEGPTHSRSQRSIEADKAALRAWVQQQRLMPGRDAVAISETPRRITMYDDGLPIAAFVLDHSDRWSLKWMRQTGRWELYEQGTYLTLAIPMLLVDEDRHGCFWG